MNDASSEDSIVPSSGLQLRPSESRIGVVGEAQISRTVREIQPPASEPTDAECVQAFRRGDSRALQILYARHAPYVLALAVRVQGHAGDVEDLVHDSFVRAQERIDSLQNDDAFRGWLAAILVSLVRTKLRKRKLLRLLGLQSSEAVDLDALVSPDAGPEARAELAEVYRVLQQLPLEARIAWTLRYVEGRKLEEVAEITECSLATVKRRLLVAREKLLLQSQLGRDAATESGSFDEDSDRDAEATRG